MRKKLLLADDSITIQKVVELTFPPDEFEVVTAGNGRIAVDKAGTFMPDMVLCDVIMPQLDGYQVCQALRAIPGLETVPILLLNGAFEPYDAEKARAVGALGNVSKPFDPPALVARVKEILAEHSTALYPRPTQPLIVADITAAAAAMAAPEPHPYTYDESETHPVSTVEVPMGVRELAARSLSLDAPVFAQAGEIAEEASEIDPADLSETLHGPLDAAGLDSQMDAGTPAEVVESTTAAGQAAEIATDAVDETEPMALEAGPATESAPAPAAEPVEFEPDAPASAGEMTPQGTSPEAEEFSGEHEFEPDEIETAPESPAATQPAGAESMTLPDELPSTGQAIGLPAPASAAPVVPPPAPVAPASGGPMPSSEVPVPVDMVQQIAQRVISQVSERVIREIAWDVIPGLAEKLIRAEIERIKARAESERD